MNTSVWRELLDDASHPARLVPAASTGLVVGLILIVLELSLTSLIFAGPLAPYATRAVGLALFGGFVMSLVVALGSTFRLSVCLPEDSSAAIVTGIAAGLYTSLSAEPEAAFVTIAAAMALSTLATGLVFYLLGRFGLGNLIRALPFPVVGGFLGGIGLLLLQGGFAIATGLSLTPANLVALCAPAKLAQWVPALAMALALFHFMRRLRSGFVLPCVLVACVAGFALYLWVTGQTLHEANTAGLLLGEMPGARMLWPVFGPGDLSLVRWSALAAQLPQLCTIPLVCAVSFLLISSGIETAARVDLDMRRDLYANALANALGGAAGSHAGYTAMSLTTVGLITGADSRLVGVIASLLTGAACFFGAQALGNTPRFILAGMILFMGIAGLHSWTFETRKRLGHLDYAMLLLIVAAIGTFGFLTGVGLGLGMALTLFAIKYSRVQVIRENTDATGVTSSRGRPIPDQLMLRRHGGELRILRVGGFLFFGSANELSNAVTEILSAPATDAAGERPKCILVDFSGVDGFDSSAVNCLLRMVQRCRAAGCSMLFAAAPRGLEDQMRRAEPADIGHVRFTAGADQGLEWCEDKLLAHAYAHLEARSAGLGRDGLFDEAVDHMLLQLEEGERFEALADGLEEYLELMSATPGEVILTRGEPLDGALVLLSGQAEAACGGGEEGGGGKSGRSRLRTLGPGAVLGNLGVRGDKTATLGVKALTDCRIGHLGLGALRRLEAADPALALAFHNHYLSQLETRLDEVLQARA